MGDWRPTTDEVKAVVPQRLSSGPFTATSRPSIADVSNLVDGVVAEVEAEVGTVPADAGLERQARWATVLGAGYYVEEGFFPEQQDSGTAERLFDRYQNQLRRLRDAIAAHGTEAGRAPLGSLNTPSAVVADYGQRALDAERYDPLSPWAGPV